jgi:hypothetical protein
MTCSLEAFKHLREAAENCPPSIRLFVVPQGIEVTRRWAFKQRTEIVSYERLVYSVGNPLLWAIEKMMALDSTESETQNRQEESSCPRST